MVVLQKKHEVFEREVVVLGNKVLVLLDLIMAAITDCHVTGYYRVYT